MSSRTGLVSPDVDPSEGVGTFTGRRRIRHKRMRSASEEHSSTGDRAMRYDATRARPPCYADSLLLFRRY